MVPQNRPTKLDFWYFFTFVCCNACSVGDFTKSSNFVNHFCVSRSYKNRPHFCSTKLAYKKTGLTAVLQFFGIIFWMVQPHRLTVDGSHVKKRPLRDGTEIFETKFWPFCRLWFCNHNADPSQPPFVQLSATKKPSFVGWFCMTIMYSLSGGNKHSKTFILHNKHNTRRVTCDGPSTTDRRTQEHPHTCNTNRQLQRQLRQLSSSSMIGGASEHKGSEHDTRPDDQSGLSQREAETS